MNEMSKEPGQTITLPDGRLLGYLIVGEGKPAFWLSPNSRLQVLLLKRIASSKHLQIIGVDRPGFGLSTHAPNRGISDFATDVSCLADHLGLGKFILAGWCAGGPYVITCAALLKQRVTQALVIGGASLPIDTLGMNRMNKIFLRFGTMPIIGTWITEYQRNMVLEMANDPDKYFKSKAGRDFLANCSEDHARLLKPRSEIRDVLFRSELEAHRQGCNSIRAFISNMKLFKKSWNVDLSQIPPGIVHIWHGTADKFVPVSNAHKNAKAIPGAHLKIFENEGHALWLNHLEEIGELLNS